MSSRCHRQARHLLPLLIFTLLASTSTAYSSQQMASGRFDRRQQTVRSPSRVLGKSSNEFSRNRTIHAALTGSLNGGGEPRSVLSTVKSIAKKNFLIVGMAGAVLLARGYPEVRQRNLLCLEQLHHLAHTSKQARKEWRRVETGVVYWKLWRYHHFPHVWVVA